MVRGLRGQRVDGGVVMGRRESKSGHIFQHALGPALFYGPDGKPFIGEMPIVSIIRQLRPNRGGPNGLMEYNRADVTMTPRKGPALKIEAFTPTREVDPRVVSPALFGLE